MAMPDDTNGDDDDNSEIEPFSPDKAVFLEAIQLNRRREQRLKERKARAYSFKKPVSHPIGQNVLFVVEDVLPDGCEVTLLKSDLPGFIKTDGRHSIGELGLGTFFCVANGLCMLQEFAGTWVTTRDESA